MGCGISNFGSSEESRRIDRQLAKDALRESAFIKLLLLGSGDSGKSTLLKQIKILHKDGFNHQELEAFKSTVFQNIYASMKAILKAMEALQIPLSEREVNAKHSALVHDLVDNEAVRSLIPLTVQAEALQTLWADRGVRECFERANEYQLQDTAAYFFSNIERIFKETYSPTTMDALNLRVMTTGVIEVPFKVRLGGRELNFKLIDVGGQRSERRKWIHCFQNVHTILFVAAISEYNQVLLEDGKTNRMEESLKLFDSIVNNAFFIRTNFILFLNKIDLFEEKIKKFDLRTHFDDFKGEPEDAEAAKKFIAAKFLSRIKSDSASKKNKWANSRVYHHFTCATNTGHIKIIFQDVVSSIINRALEDDAGLQ